jgi:uncharacterized membrane protein HdeD (DUF308 family)
VLAALLGIWFIVMGVFEIIGAFLFRRALSQAEASEQASAGVTAR